MKRRIFALLLCLLLTALFAACTPVVTDPENPSGEDGTTPSGGSKTQTLYLPYSKADPMHPFKSESQYNQQLATLLYDSLYRTDTAYKPVALLAQSGSLQGLTLTVQLKSGRVFSDGSAVTAAAVVESFNLAKTAPAYRERLANFKQAQASGNAVVFTLAAADPYCTANLDFAIIKAQSEDLPIGGGRYIYKETEAGPILEQNTRYAEFAPSITKATLVDVPGTDTLFASLAIGNISFAFHDLKGGAYQRINANVYETGMSNLVYLAFNKNKATVKSEKMRQAILLSLDREAIVQTAFQGHAQAAATLFHPQWYTLGEGDNAFSLTPELTRAEALLKDAGYKKGTQLTLLVNADNGFKKEAADLVRTQLAKAGISVTVTALKQTEYESAVKKGSYDLYIGEIKLTPSMNLSSLLLPGGSVNYGIDTTGPAAEKYTAFLRGEINLLQFWDAFSQNPSVVPLCYRNAIAAYTRTLHVPGSCRESDVYHDIESWKFS